MQTKERCTTTVDNLPEETIRSYRREGFVDVRGVISKDEAEEFRQAAMDAYRRLPRTDLSGVFTLVADLWRKDPVMRRLTLHPNIGAIAEKLTGQPLRIWSDNLLVKEPNNQKATVFHQDETYEPLANNPSTLSVWIALCDVPVERGCMTFIPNAQHLAVARDVDFFGMDEEDPFRSCPELRWHRRVTVPLRAGDCTFHHLKTPHMANRNSTSEHRVAHVAVFTDLGTIYTGNKVHPAVDSLGLTPGQSLDNAMFPEVRKFAAIQSLP